MALADVAQLIVALRLDDKGFTGKLNSASASLSRMDKGLGQMGRGAGQLGSGIGKLATVTAAAAAGGLAAVVTTAASFEQAFTGVEKTVDGTDAQLAELEETLRGMARTMPVSFEELAGIGEAGGALGIARESLDEFVDVVARLAVSTDLSSDAAATSLGQLGTVLKLSGQDYEDFADSLVALGNAGASTESQIVEIAARFGAAGNSAGLSKEEILALSSAVASMGIDAEAGGSSLSRIFSNVATAIGTGSDKVEAFTELMGISADEFKEQWSQDALGTFQDFLVELGKLDQFEQADVLKNAGITGVRDINAVRLMSQNVGFVADQLTIAKDATGALGKESDKFFGTTQAQWQILQNNVRDAAAVIGTELLPVVNEVIGDFVGFLAKPGSQAGLKNFAKDLAQGVRDLVTEIKGADFGPIIEGFKGAAGIAKAGFDAFNSLPAGVKSIALAALGVNKLTGGALTDIAKGFGNLFAGGLKLLIPGLERGGTPVNPIFTKEVGLGGAGGGAIGAGDKAGGARGALGGAAANVAKFVLGPLAAVAIGSEIAKSINEATIRPAIDFEAEQFETVLATGDAEAIAAAIATLEDGIDGQGDVLGRIALEASALPLIGDALGNAKVVLESQRDTLYDQLAEMGYTREQIEGLVAAVERTNAVTTTSPGGATGSFTATDTRPIEGPPLPPGFSANLAASFDRALTAQFGGKLEKLATNDVLAALGRTTEIGLKDVGTTFQVGLATGMDPLGDVATRLLSQAENPKDPPVMAEINGHLMGLEQIQASYLASGDVHLAAKVQTNIDTLHRLIGTTDTQNAIIAAQAAAAATSDAAMISSANRITAEVAAKGAAQIGVQFEALAAVRATQGPLNTIVAKNDAQLSVQAQALEAARGQTGYLGTIAAKNFSPIVNVNVPVNNFISINEWQRTVQSAQTSYSTNSGGI